MLVYVLGAAFVRSGDAGGTVRDVASLCIFRCGAKPRGRETIVAVNRPVAFNSRQQALDVHYVTHASFPL